MSPIKTITGWKIDPATDALMGGLMRPGSQPPLRASAWDPNKHPRGAHGHWSATMSQSLRQFQDEGGQVEEANPDQVEAARDTLSEMCDMAGQEFAEQVGTFFTSYALRAMKEFGDPAHGGWGHVYVANVEGLGVGGAIGLVDRPDDQTVHVDYLGSTGLASGTGTSLAVAAAKHAASKGWALLGEPTDDARPFWKKLGWKPDPEGTGSTGWGWSAADTAKVARLEA